MYIFTENKSDSLIQHLVCVCVCVRGGVHMEQIGLVERVDCTIGGVTYDARAQFCSLLLRF